MINSSKINRIQSEILSSYDSLLNVYLNRDPKSEVPFGFDDKVGFGTGVQPQATGLFSMLYIYDALNKSETVEKELFAKLKDLTVETYKEINKFVEENGFSGAPYIVFKENEENKWLGKDTHSYFGDLTWLLSLSLIIRKLHFRNEMDLTEIMDDVIKNIIECSKTIVEAQIAVDEDSGAWGFSSNADQPSLYFSYIVSASLSDMLDTLTDDINQDFETRLVDNEIISQMTAIKTGSGNLYSDIETARVKLQNWFSKYVLPLIQDLSKCRKPRVDNDILEKAGFFTIRTEADKNKRELQGLDEFEDFNYFYYALYAIDMFVMSRTDEVFESIYTDAENKNRKKELFDFYSKHKLFSMVDLKYFSDDNNNDFITKYLEENMNNMHASYNRFTRTGVNYWESSKATYGIHLKYKDLLQQDDFDNAIENIDNLRDSVILPLFLKVNIQHCKWVTKESDKIIDAIADDILFDRITKEDTQSAKARQKQLDNENYINLWDKVHFNLLITEKSIEALIDYYEYLKYFESDVILGKADTVHNFKTETSHEITIEKSVEHPLVHGLKALIESTVLEMLNKDLVEDLINSKVNQILEAQKETFVSNDVKRSEKRKGIDDIANNLIELTVFNGSRKDTKEDLSYLDLFNGMVRGNIYRAMKTSDSDKAHFSEKVKNTAQNISEDMNYIITSLAKDIEEDPRALMMLFKKLKDL